jgi:cytochrome c peroxidase
VSVEVEMTSRVCIAVFGCLFLVALATSGQSVQIASDEPGGHLANGRHLFARETFGGNGRTCLTCHSRETGTVSPEEAQRRFASNPNDPLFAGDGSDDGEGHGTTRMLADATVLIKVPLAPKVSLLADPDARFVTVRRGIPTTLNTPALDPVLMYDGRAPSLTEQARGAVLDHASPARMPSAMELLRLAEFQHGRPFLSSNAMWQFAVHGRTPELPQGRTEAERRGRLFFEDRPFGPGNSNPGVCAICHSGPMLNETNEFIPVPPFGRGGRFQTAFVSELNQAGNPVIEFLFKNPDGTVRLVRSADPGRALITGDPRDFDSLNAFKIPTLWGVARTAPYFHDNSAKTLEDVARHYKTFFEIATGPDFDGDPPIVLTEEDQADIVAFLKLLR